VIGRVARFALSRVGFLAYLALSPPTMLLLILPSLSAQQQGHRLARGTVLSILIPSVLFSSAMLFRETAALLSKWDGAPALNGWRLFRASVRYSAKLSCLIVPAWLLWGWLVLIPTVKAVGSPMTWRVIVLSYLFLIPANVIALAGLAVTARKRSSASLLETARALKARLPHFILMAAVMGVLTSFSGTHRGVFDATFGVVRFILDSISMYGAVAFFPIAVTYLSASLPSAVLESESGMKKMNQEEARQVVLEELKRFKSMPYAHLREFVLQEKADAYYLSHSDTKYEIKVMFYWDIGKPGNIRVIGQINVSGGWSAYRPYSQDFIMRPDGSLVE
jgi:hypothetical protein